MRFLPAFVGIVLFHIMAAISTLLGLGPYYFRIFWDGDLDLIFTALLVFLSYSPSFAIGVLSTIFSAVGAGGLSLRKSISACFKNILIGMVGFVFTGVFIGIALDSLIGNTNYILYTGWVGITFPIHIIISGPLGILTAYILILIAAISRH